MNIISKTCLLLSIETASLHITCITQGYLECCSPDLCLKYMYVDDPGMYIQEVSGIHDP